MSTKREILTEDEVSSMSESGTGHDSQLEASTLRKLDLRLLPVLCFLAVITTIDTTNLGRAQVTGLSEELNLKGHEYNIAIFVYFLPLIFLDVPATLLLYASRPSWFIAGAVFLLSVATVCEGVVQNFAGLVVCRILLGVGEMAFQTGGVVLIVTHYPQHFIHSRISLFLICRLIASAFGGLLSFGIAHMDGIADYSAWRWIFIIDGLLTFASMPCAFFLPRWPHKPDSLFGFSAKRSPSISSDGEPSASRQWWTMVKESLQNPVVYFGALIHFCCVAASSSSVAFTPTILHELGWSSMKSLYMEIPIPLTTALVTLIVSIASDRARHRFAFCVVPLSIAAVAYGILISGQEVSIWVRYGACFALSYGYFPAMATSIAWLSNNVHGQRRRGIALGIAAGISNCGSVLGSNVYLQDQAPRYLTGFGVCLALILLAIVVATAQLFYLIWDNERRGVGEKHDRHRNQY